MGFTADQFVYLIGLVAGVAGVPVTNLIKKALGVYGRYALTVASMLSIALGVVVVAVSGVFIGVEINLDTIIQASTEVFSVATILYKALQADKPK